MTPLLFAMVDAVLMADGWSMTAAEYAAPGLERFLSHPLGVGLTVVIVIWVVVGLIIMRDP